MKNDNWKCFLFQILVGIAITIPLFLPGVTKAEGYDSIRVIEYYFDQDPGIGNGIVLNTDSTPAYVANEVIDISALSEGIHTIYFRTQDSTGVWGVPFGKSFYAYNTLETDSTNVPVANLEYSFDNTSSFSSLGTITQDTSVSMTTNIDIAGLSDPGIHTIYVRAKDTHPHISSMVSKSFFVYQKTKADSTLVPVTDIEYSFDSISNFIPISGIDPDTSVSVEANLDINNLIGPGNHTVFFRAKDANNYFSFMLSDTFNVENEIPVANAGTDQFVDAGSLVTLDGSASYDPNKLAVTYLWTAPGIITLSSNTDSKPTITTPEVITDTTFMFSLIVNDGIFDSPADTVLVIVMHHNLTISDTTFLSGFNECFDAFDTITVAGSGTNVSLLSGSSTDFIAGHSIRFLPGFHALTGSNMDANITTDSSFCVPPAPGNIALEPSEKSVNEENYQKPEIKGNSERSIKIFPNPNNGRFTIELSNFENPVKVTMVNMIGATIYSPQQINSGSYEMDLSGIDKGIYLVRIDDGETLTSKKIVIQ
jgi:hypothetical protein